MRSFAPLPAAALTLAALAAGQAPTMVYPLQAAMAEGESSVADHHGGAPWWPLDSQTPGDQYFHMQLLVDMPASFNGDISSISYRRDGTTLPGFSLEQFDVDMQVTLSTAKTTAATTSTSFAANTGNDALVVLARRNVVFGAKAFVGSFPEPFVYTINFDQPFHYDASKGSLCIDVLHWSNDLHNPLRLTPLDVAVDAMVGSKIGASLRNGSRCAPPNPWLPPIDLHAEMMVDDSGAIPMLQMYAWRQYAQHHSRGFLIASLGLTSPGVPVPGYGAGGCGYIVVDLSQQLFFAIGNSSLYGAVRWPADPTKYLLDIPYNPYYAGFKFYVQELNYDVHTQVYNATNWVLTQIPNYLPNGQTIGMRTMWAEGPSSHTATTGTLGTLGIGPVMQFN